MPTSAPTSGPTTPTELYFEFDDRATSVSASPGLFFCRAATEVLTPGYTSKDAWCDYHEESHKFYQRIAHGHLTNARITLPTLPVAINDTTMQWMSDALLAQGFFVSNASVMLITHYQKDQGLNIGLTVATFVILILTTIVPWVMRKCRVDPSYTPVAPVE